MLKFFRTNEFQASPWSRWAPRNGKEMRELFQIVDLCWAGTLPILVRVIFTNAVYFCSPFGTGI